MSGHDKKIQPIIIKRIKKHAHGHHGGAWKIAYADFVTAMMAFFLLMWLLGSTAKGDLNGIASYFQSPLKVAMSGGSGSGDSSSIIKGGGTDLSRTTGNARRGDVQVDQKKLNLQALKAELAKLDAEKIRMLRMKIEQAIDGNQRLKQFRSQVRIDITRDGLRIQIVDDQNRPMFDMGSAVVKDYMRELLREIGHTLNEVDNRITLSGHTDASPYAGGERGYSNWELSAERANASRRELIAGGMDESKIVRVIGLASSTLLNRDDPKDPTNRRISIVVLTAEALERLEAGGDIQASDAEQVRDAVGLNEPDEVTTPTTATPLSAAGPTAAARKE